MGLYQKLHKIMKACDYLQKDKENAHFKYWYLSEAAIKRKVHQELVDQGVLFLPTTCKIVSVEKGFGKEGNEVLTHVEYGFKFVDIETGESHEGTGIGSGSDKLDKGVYKALTGALKYIFTGSFVIETGDDPEEEPKPTKEEKKQESTNAKAAAQSVATVKLAAAPAPSLGSNLPTIAELEALLASASRVGLDNAAKDLVVRLDSRYGTGYGLSFSEERKGKFGAVLTVANFKQVIREMYDELIKPEDVQNELQEYLDGMTDVGSTVFAFKLLRERLTVAVGGGQSDMEYGKILAKQGVKHSNEFKGKGMDAKAKAALTELYNLVVKEEQVPA